MFAGDILVLQGDAHTIRELTGEAGLDVVGTDDAEPSEAVSPAQLGVVEAVVMAGSVLIGCSPIELRLRDRFGVTWPSAVPDSRRKSDCTVRASRSRTSLALNATFGELFGDYAPEQAISHYEAFDARRGADLRALREVILKNSGTPVSADQVR
jgi:hypothetical protein